MKYPDETEAEFEARRNEARLRGVVIWRDDRVREEILDIIYAYLDVLDLVNSKEA